MKYAVSKHFFYFVEDSKRQIYDKRLAGRYKKQQNIPNHLSKDPTDPITKIEVYEDRVLTWFLDIGEKLKKNRAADFVMLSIAVAYVEGNQQFREGRWSYGKSEEFFVRGMRRIFEKDHVPDFVLSMYYKQIRCGLFHDGMTGKKVVISRSFQAPLNYTGSSGSIERIEINPPLFLDCIIRDFRTYIGSLKAGIDPRTPLTSNFEKMWKIQNESSVTSDPI